MLSCDKGSDQRIKIPFQSPIEQNEYENQITQSQSTIEQNENENPITQSSSLIKSIRLINLYKTYKRANDHQLLISHRDHHHHQLSPESWLKLSP